MATTTTNLGLSQLQTEFGGASPIALSEYYRGGAYVPTDQYGSFTDGVLMSSSGTLRMGMFRGVTKTAGAALSSTWVDGQSSGSPTGTQFTVSAFPEVFPSGGNGTYTYQWSYISSMGTSISGSTTDKFVNVRFTVGKFGGTVDAVLQCVITSNGASITLSNIHAIFDYPDIPA